MLTAISPQGRHAPGALAYTQCLIAVNCGAVFSTQTKLALCVRLWRTKEGQRSLMVHVKA